MIEYKMHKLVAMSLKTANKQEVIKVGTPAKDGKKYNYSNLPLFDFGDSDALHLTMEKEKKSKGNNEDKFASTPPFPLKSKSGSAKPVKSKTSKESPVSSQAVPPQHSTKVVPETNPVLLTVSDICKLLKVSRSTLIRIEKAGQLPGRVMLGGSVRYHRETIDAWLHDLAVNRH